MGFFPPGQKWKMSEKCLIFTTEHREHVAEVRVKISANSWKSKTQNWGRHAWQAVPGLWELQAFCVSMSPGKLLGGVLWKESGHSPWGIVGDILGGHCSSPSICATSTRQSYGLGWLDNVLLQVQELVLVSILSRFCIWHTAFCRSALLMYTEL